MPLETALQSSTHGSLIAQTAASSYEFDARATLYTSHAARLDVPDGDGLNQIEVS